MSRIDEHPFAVGMKVYDTVGYTVGTLHTYNPQGGYLAVRPGRLFHGKDRYVPVDAVDHSGVTGGASLPRNDATRDISLLLSRDDLKAIRYNAPPTRHLTTIPSTHVCGGWWDDSGPGSDPDAAPL